MAPIQVTNPSMRLRTDGRLRPMTAREKLLERVMTLSEAEEDEALRLVVLPQDVPNATDRGPIADRAVASGVVVVVEPVWQRLGAMP